MNYRFSSPPSLRWLASAHSEGGQGPRQTVPPTLLALADEVIE